MQPLLKKSKAKEVEDALQIQDGIIRDLKNLIPETQILWTSKEIPGVLMDLNQDKHKETHLNFPIVITYLKMITGSGE